MLFLQGLHNLLYLGRELGRKAHQKYDHISVIARDFKCRRGNEQWKIECK